MALPVMEPQQATRLLLEQIPLLAHLELHVTEVTPDMVGIQAPLRANANHHGTAFGGSLSLIGIVAGWLLAYSGQGQGRVPPTRNIVIAETSTRYLRPLTADLHVRAHWSDATAAAYRQRLAGGVSASVRIHVNVGATQTTSEADSAMIQTNRYVAVPE